VSKIGEEPSDFWLKLVSIVLLIFAFIGLLGSLGFSIGKLVYSMFTVVMGSLAWTGPILCLVAAVLLWIYSPKLTDRRRILSDYETPDEFDKSNVQPDIFSKGISLPPGKLVNLQGFDQYFSTPEMVEMKDTNVQKTEEMKEMGEDFPSYFGNGESFYPRKLGKMTNLKGLKGYIEEVDEEERVEREISWPDNYTPRDTPKTPTDKPPLFSSPFTSPFKTPEEQEAYLAQFRDTISEVDKEELVFIGAVREANETPEVLEVKPEILVIEELKHEPEPEPEPEIVNPMRIALMEAACSSLGIQMLEDPETVDDEAVKAVEQAQEAHVPILTLKPRQEVSVAPVEDLTLETVNRWILPDFDLLDPVVQRVIIQDTETPKQLEKVLLDFGVKAKVIRVTRGPVITRYELAPAPGVKISKIVNLADDIALGLAARDVRIEAPIPGKAAIGIEVPNKHARSVPFREVLETTGFGEHASKLKVALGKDIADQPIIGDLIKMPHLLVAGATGSGKSVCITSIINSILYNATPDEVKLLLVDPKMVELSQYNGIPHLLAPVVVDPKKAAAALRWIVKEMENRYELFAAAGVRDIERYNKLKAGQSISSKPALPFMVVIIDELADLMMVAAGEVEEAICRIAQMARAAGIHLVIATQRPSVDVITGVIKANIPSRISFAVSSQIDSRTILDATGAEKLLGRGDMLYSPLGVNKALRVQGCLVTDEEVQRVITHWKALGRPEYLDPERLFAETSVKNEESNGPDDVLFIDAGQLFIRTGIASVSFLQRKLKLGYTRAARLMDMLEEQGIVGTYEGSKPRQVLLTLEEFNERFG